MSDILVVAVGEEICTTYYSESIHAVTTVGHHPRIPLPRLTMQTNGVIQPFLMLSPQPPQPYTHTTAKVCLLPTRPEIRQRRRLLRVHHQQHPHQQHQYQQYQHYPPPLCWL